MKITLFVGDIADAPAAAVCTSTNPRLTLMMGTGAAIRERGGFEVLRECERIVAASGRPSLPPGSVHATTAGRLPFRVALHCVASDSTHRSSIAIVRACVANALAAAETHGCASVAMPVFGTGHAHVKFDAALQAILETLRGAATTVEQVVIVVEDEARAREAAQQL